MTAGRYVLAIDQRTTSTRAMLFDAEGRPSGMAQKELAQIYPEPGWVEHDPEEIWASTLEACRVGAAVSRARNDGSERVKAADRKP